jgi:hypothetical protein
MSTKNRSRNALKPVCLVADLGRKRAPRGFFNKLEYSRKFLCSILYRETKAQPIALLSLVLRTGSDYDILDWRIKMRWRGYIALSSPRYIGTCREMIRSPLQ